MAKESSGRSASGNDADLSIKSAQADLLKKKKLNPEQKDAKEVAAAEQAEGNAIAPDSEHVEVAQAAGAAPAGSSSTTTTTTTGGGSEGLSTGAYLALGGGALGLAAIALGSGGGGGGGGNNNDAPVATGGTFTTNEDTVLNGNVVANDPDGDTLVYSVATGPATGTLNLNQNGTFTYTPAPNVNGSVSFTYVVTDPDGESSSATVTINISPVNDAPVIAVVPVQTGTEDTVLNGTLPAAVDPDTGATITYALVSGSSAGAVTVSPAGAFTFAPNANFNGATSFTFSVSDGQGGTNTYTQNITVTPVNDAPVSSNITVSATEDTPFNGTLPAALDVDGNPVTFALGTQSANGTAVVNANGSFVFNPAANFSGVTTFTFTVSDGQGGTNTYTATVNVANVNDAPVSSGATVTVAEDNVLMGTLPAATDADGNAVTFSLATGSPNGTVVVNASGTFTFTPAPNFNGATTFSFTVSDGQGGSNTYIVNVNVTPVNDAPVAIDPVTIAATEDTVLSGNLPAAFDADGNNLTYSLVGGSVSTGGTLVINGNGSFVFTPNPNFNGPVTFQYVVTDGTLSDTASGTINVASVNDVPVANNDAVTTQQGVPLNIAAATLLGNDTDADGNTLTIASFTQPAGGSVTFNAGTQTFTYTPLLATTGNDTFTYTVSDGNGGTATATVTVNVQQTNFIFTPGTDSFGPPTTTGNNETFLASNTNLNAGDSVNGGGGFDTVIHAIDSGIVNVFAGFNFQNVDVFQVTSDAPLSGGTTYDLSSSGPIGVLRVVNSTDDITFNSAGAGANVANTTFLEVLDQTAAGIDVSLDIRDIDVAGATDVVDVTLRSATNVGDALNNLNIDEGAEQVRIHTNGPLQVVIDTLNTDFGGGTSLGATSLILDALTASLTIRDPLSANVKTVDGSTSTQNLSYTALNANGNTSLSGGSGNDTIVGATNFFNNINGNAGNDTLTGGAQGDSIVGGLGNDSVAGLAGGDNIVTGAGNDTVDGGAGNDVIDSGDDNDLVTDGIDNDVVTTGLGTDTVNLASGSDTVNLGDGNDVISVGSNLSNADSVVGGAGNDTMNVGNDNAVTDLDRVVEVERIVLAENGTPYSYTPTNGLLGPSFENDGATLKTIDGSGLTSSLTFNGVNLDSDDEIILIGGQGNDTLIGGAGNDTIIGNLGNDSLVGNDGNDRFEFDGGELNAADSVSGGNGVDTVVLIDDSFEFGGPEEQFVIDAGFTGVENVLVDDQANGGDVALTINAGYAQSLLTIDATALDANEDFILFAQNNGATESLNVTSGAGNDTLQFGAGTDTVVAGDGADLIAFDNGDGVQDLTNLDRVDGGSGTDTLQIIAGAVDGNFAGVSSVEILTIDALGSSSAGEGTTVIGTSAQNAGIRTVNLNPNNEDGVPTGGANAATDTLNASAYTADLTVNDFGGNDSISTGTGADVINFGSGSDSVASGSGADQFFVQNTELDFTDSLAGGAGNDSVRMDNAPGAVNAAVNLSTVTDVENYTFTFNGNRAVGVDADNNTLVFTGGNVGTVNIINIDASALTDTDDSFTVTLDGGQTDADYSFFVTGSATNDTFIKQNTPVQNFVQFTGGLGSDTLELNGDSQGANIVFDGDGLGAPSNAIATPLTFPTLNYTGDTVRSSGGTFIDNDFTNFDNIEILTANNGVSLNAVLGAFAAASGINVIIGSNVNDNVLFNAAWNSNAILDISAGGNDTFNAGASAATFRFRGDSNDYTTADTLIGGTGSADIAEVRNDNGTANLTTTTNVEFVNVDRTQTGGDLTIILDTTVADLNGTTFQTVNASTLQNTGNPENLTLVAITATANLSVTAGAGNDTLLDGTGNSTLLGGSGNDFLNGGDGTDRLEGGAGNDFIITGLANISTGDLDADLVIAGEGMDTVIASSGGDSIVLTETTQVEDIVQINPHTATVAISGPPVISGFVAGVDELRINSVITLDGTQSLAQNSTAVAGVRGQSWKNDGYPELTVISTTATAATSPSGVNTALGAAEFLSLNDLASDLDPNTLPVGNGQKGIFALTDGTNTYLWLYTDDSDSTISASDFQLVGTLLGVNNLQAGDLRLTAGTFTPGDDVVFVADGSTVDGLDGNDTILLVDNGTNGAVVEASNIEIVYGTAGNDTITFNDADTVPAVVEVFGNGTFGGGSDVVNLSNGQTLIAHSNFDVIVGGGNAVDDNVNGNTLDASPETVILADDGAPHSLSLTGVENVVGSSGNDTITWKVNNNASVNGNAGNDTVNGANGGDTNVGNQTGQSITVTGVELTLGNVDNDTITVIGANGTVDGGQGADTVLGQNSDDSITTINVESISALGGNDTVNASGNLISVTVNGGAGNDSLLTGAGTDTFNFNIPTDGADTVSGGTDNFVYDQVAVSGAANPIRLTFTSADVGNGDVLDGNNTPSSNGALPYGGAEDGGVAVRFQTEDGADNLIGVVSRYEDEGITFTGAQFDVRDLGLGLARGTFSTVSLLTMASETFNGTSSNDYINSGMGNDSLSGLANNDFLVGGAGNDTLDGGIDQDTLLGGGGNDDLRGDSGADVLNSGGGTDTLSGGAGTDTGVGSTGGDLLTVDTLESLSADAGADVVTVTDSTTITIDLGAGVDAVTFSGTAGNGSVNGGAGTDPDTVSGSSGPNVISLAAIEIYNGTASGADTITVTDTTPIVMTLQAGDDSVNFGNDTGGSFATINGGLGNDTVLGDDGVDVLSVLGVDSVNTAGGNDQVSVTDATPILIALGAGLDNLLFTAPATATVNGNGGGVDTIVGSTDSDTLVLSAFATGTSVNTGAGADTVSVNDTSAVIIELGLANDLVNFSNAGGAGGGTGTINGDAGSDTVVGSSANDNFQVQDVNTVSTFGGSDVVVVTDSTPVGIDLGAQNDQVTFTVAAVASVTGGANNDTVTGSSAADTFTLNTVESLSAGSGADVVTVTDNSALTANLGAGNDLLNFSNGNTGSSIDGGADNDTVTGSTANDVFTTINVESLSGGGGSDVYNVGGNVTILGGAGQDTVNGTAGTDNIQVTAVEQLNALADNDNLTVTDSTGITVDLGAGSDTITFQVGANGTLNGSVGQDTLTGSSQSDVFVINASSSEVIESISLGGGNDTLTDNTADFDLITVSAGAGDDSVFATTDGSYSGDAGNDTITFGPLGGSYTVSGGLNSDSVTGGSGSEALVLDTVESVNSGAGVDGVTVTDTIAITVDLAAGNDTLSFSGASSSATVTGGANSDTVNGSSGVDTLSVNTVESLSTGSGADVITVTDNTGITINAGDGSDTITFNGTTGGFGSGTVTGGAGTDAVSGSTGADVISVNTVESVSSGAGSDTITVTDTTVITVDLGSDADSLTFTGSSTVATITGGAGNDSVTGSGGSDTLNLTTVESVAAGIGSDTVVVTDGTSINADLGNDADTISFTGSTGNASITGGAGTDTATGSTGADTFSVASLEALNTGSGADLITVTDSTLITVDLGDGADNISFTGGAGSTATVTGGAGADSVTGSGTDDTFSVNGVEQVTGGVGLDRITVTDSIGTSVNGNADSDTIIGGGGADTLNGGGSPDFVFAGLGNDIVIGDTGGDTLNGGLGRDTLTGGNDADVFRFTVGETASNTGTDADQITDFVTGTDDIAFAGGASGTGANYAEAGPGLINDFADALVAANLLMDGTTIYVFATNGTNAWLFYDANANGVMDVTGDAVVQLNGLTSQAAFGPGDIIAGTGF